MMRDYYKQLYENKLDSLEEMDKLLEMHSLPETEPGRNTIYEQTNHKH